MGTMKPKELATDLESKPFTKGKYPGLEPVKELLERTGGNLSEVARQLGVARITVYRWCTQIPELTAAVHQSREAFVDEMEELLIDQARKGNIAAIIFGLKTQGKARGYIERATVDVNVNQERKKEQDSERDAAYLSEVVQEMKRLAAGEGAEPEAIEGEYESLPAETEG